MGRSGRYAEAFALGKSGDRASKPDDVGTRLLDVCADTGADFDHRLVHLRLDLLAQEHSPLVDHLGDMRT